MTIALVDHCIGGSLDASTVVTSAMNSTGATFACASLAITDAASLVTFTDSLGNNYTSLTKQAVSLDVTIVLGYVANPTVGAVVALSASTSGATGFPALAGAVFSGVTTTSPFDTPQENGAHSTGASSLATGSITPSVNGCLILVGGGNNGGKDFSSISGSGTFTNLDHQADAGNHWGNNLSYLVQGTAGAENATVTISGSTTLAVAIASFLPAAGGGGNVVSGGATEGADTASGSIKVAVKASGGVTEGKDATSGSVKLASKVSGGATEGPDATAGSVKVALKVSGGVTEGADFTTGAISVGSTHVSGNLTEGADATGGGSIKVALHLSGGPTEGKDATAGNLLVAVKVSGGVTEGADFTTGSITATSRTISGGFTEGADRTSGIIISGTVSQGGHFLPLTKKEIAEARKRAKAARDKEEAGWDQAAKDKADLHQQIMKTLRPEKILGIGKVEKLEEDEDEADIEMLLLYG